MKVVRLRQARVGDLVGRTIAELIQKKVKDPRLEGVTITGADVSVDLKAARIYFCVMGRERKGSVLEGLASAAGYLRRELGRELHMKAVPSLSFAYDESFDHGARIDEILDSLASHQDDGKE
ncbi:MAG TPA: 30S ribosome-binding factor RbfA [Deltaproteobacteria bacterium]|nr:30S ribosome-binding factor RbfA [Deltaproteobacteria bacterium]